MASIGARTAGRKMAAKTTSSFGHTGSKGSPCTIDDSESDDEIQFIEPMADAGNMANITAENDSREVPHADAGNMAETMAADLMEDDDDDGKVPIANGTNLEEAAEPASKRHRHGETTKGKQKALPSLAPAAAHEQVCKTETHMIYLNDLCLIFVSYHSIYSTRSSLIGGRTLRLSRARSGPLQLVHVK